MKNSTITTMGMTYHDEQDEEEDDQFDDCYLNAGTWMETWKFR